MKDRKDRKDRGMSTLRPGVTTGTCAAAAAKAAVMILLNNREIHDIDVGLPDGSRMSLPLLYVRINGVQGEAAVSKDAGDDPDITDGAVVVASVVFTDEEGVHFAAGEGVGTVTKPGLSIPIGEPAINPVPRRMVEEAVREVTGRGIEVTISIPGGRVLAERTFNPRLGIEGGLSILGTTGVVRPFSHPALQTSLKCALDVAAASNVSAPVFVPGHIGERAARKYFNLGETQVIEVSNEWGFMLDRAGEHSFSALLVLGHPGKLAKLAQGDWDTHSSRSRNSLPFLYHLAEDLFGRLSPETTTVEGFFSSFSDEERRLIGDRLAAEIHRAVTRRIGGKFTVSVVLVNIRGEWLGSSGETELWT